MSNKKLIKPGTDNQPAGDYEEVGPRGGKVSHPKDVHIDPGDKMPPTSETGHRWTPKKG